jgi:hypothetical protein
MTLESNQIHYPQKQQPTPKPKKSNATVSILHSTLLKSMNMYVHFLFPSRSIHVVYSLSLSMHAHAFSLPVLSQLISPQHRGIFLTHPPTPAHPGAHYSGTLFHASYISPSPSDATIPSEWILEQRHVKDVSSAHSLVLLYRIGTLDTTHRTIDDQIQSIRDVLEAVPLGRSNREQILGPLKENEGNKVLGGYDCVIWTRDAVAALADAGLITLCDKSAGELSFCFVNVTVMKCDELAERLGPWLLQLVFSC